MVRPFHVPEGSGCGVVTDDDANVVGDGVTVGCTSADPTLPITRARAMSLSMKAHISR
jgi:hypothetical protein